MEEQLGKMVIIRSYQDANLNIKLGTARVFVVI